MKILIVSTFDIQGGAARAAYRLHRALLNEEIDSQMLVQSKSSDDYTVIGPESKIQKGLGIIRPTLDHLPVNKYKNRTDGYFSPSWLPLSKIVKQINSIKPDVVHLHWIAGGMMRIEDIASIDAPIVWSLHDDWPFTGGCHVKWDCDRYLYSCGKCPILNSTNTNDLSRKIYFRKFNTYSKLKRIYITGVSHWLVECAQKSSLLNNFPVTCFPNLIDTKTFLPFEKESARKLLNIPDNKKIILFGAISATSDINKGFQLLVEALQLIESENIELVVFGSSQPKIKPPFKQKTHYIGHMHDDVSLRILYSAADVMVVPSLQEAFGQTASESMACGTPVVAFATSGLLDIVDHKINGYLAKPYETNDLASGIEWVLLNREYEKLCLNAREKVVMSFSHDVVVKQYIELYKKII